MLHVLCRPTSSLSCYKGKTLKHFVQTMVKPAIGVRLGDLLMRTKVLLGTTQGAVKQI